VNFFYFILFVIFFLPQAYLFEKLFPKKNKKKTSKIPSPRHISHFFLVSPFSRLTPVLRDKGFEKKTSGEQRVVGFFFLFFSPSLTALKKRRVDLRRWKPFLSPCSSLSFFCVFFFPCSHVKKKNRKKEVGVFGIGGLCDHLLKMKKTRFLFLFCSFI